jgi:Flp pilus assembly protein TadB
MIAAGLLGAGTGLGLLLIGYGLWPPRPSLAQILAALHPAPTPSTGDSTLAASDRGGWAARLGRVGVPLLNRLGLPRPRTRADLEVCDRDPARHTAEQACAAAIGFVLPMAVAAVLALFGISLGVLVPAWASLLLAVAGLILPEHSLHAEAVRRRADLRIALSGMLDLVVVSLAGGAGVEQALRDATDEPRTWGQRRLRQALHSAQLTRVPPWQTLGHLGHDTDVPALTELAAALSLAGSEGARVRTTLTARAASLRDHDLSEAEAAAASATEKMSLPVVALFGGFLVFIGFPALSAVLAAL